MRASSRYSINDSVIKNLKIEIFSLTETDIDFDLIGVDASIANALRCCFKTYAAIPDVI